MLTHQQISESLNQKFQNDSSINYRLSSQSTKDIQKLYQSHHDDKILTCHQDRTVYNNSCVLTLFKRHSDNSLGEAHTSLDCNQSLESLQKQIDTLLNTTQYTKNSFWELPDCTQYNYPEVLTASPDIINNELKMASYIESKLQEELQKIPSEIHFHSAEIYVTSRETRVEHSKGFSKKTSKTQFYLEIAISKPSQPDSEVLQYLTGTDKKDLSIKEFVQRCIDQCLSLGKTEVSQSSEQVVCCLDISYMARIIEAITLQCQTINRYNKRPFLPINQTFPKDPIQGDHLNLDLNPLIPMMAASSSFNSDGLPAQKGTLIHNNEVQNHITSVRAATYLNEKPNGFTGTIQVQTGLSSWEDWIKEWDEILHIIHFSSLLVDPTTLTWSSEIGFAWLYKNGKKYKKIKGGILSGSIPKNISHCFFSSNEAVYNFPGDSYHSSLSMVGPKQTLICQGISCSGETS